MLRAYPCLILHRGGEQSDGVLLRNSSFDCLLAQPLEPHLSVKCGQIQQPCRGGWQLCLWGPGGYFWARWRLRHMLTNSVLWWQVDSVGVEILQEGSVHQVWKLVHFYAVFIRFIQQRTEMLTSGGTKRKTPHDKDFLFFLFFSTPFPQSRVILSVSFACDPAGAEMLHCCIYMLMCSLRWLQQTAGLLPTYAAKEHETRMLILCVQVRL